MRKERTPGGISVRAGVQQDTTLARMEAIPPFPDWEASIDAEQRADPVWRMKMYRLALYALDASWLDVMLLARNPATRGVARNSIGRSARSVPVYRKATAESQGRIALDSSSTPSARIASQSFGTRRRAP